MPLREAAMSETKRKPGDYVHFEDCGCEKCLPKPETCPKCGSNCREIRICRHTSPPIEQRIAGTTYTHTIADPRCNLRCGHDWHKGATPAGEAGPDKPLTTVVTAEAPAQPTLQSGPNRERYIAKGPKVDGEQIRRPAKSCEAAASPSAEPAKPGETVLKKYGTHLGDCEGVVGYSGSGKCVVDDAKCSCGFSAALRGETASLTCHPHPLVKPGHPFTLHGEVNGHKWKLECPGLQESWTFELKSGGVRADCRVTVTK